MRRRGQIPPAGVPVVGLYGLLPCHYPYGLWVGLDGLWIGFGMACARSKSGVFAMILGYAAWLTWRIRMAEIVCAYPFCASMIRLILVLFLRTACLSCAIIGRFVVVWGDFGPGLGGLECPGKGRSRVPALSGQPFHSGAVWTLRMRHVV